MRTTTHSPAATPDNPDANDHKSKKARALGAIKTAADRVKHAGRGRPPLDPSVPTTGMSLRMTVNQRTKVDRIGGAAFLRKCIDNAKEPALAPAAKTKTADIIALRREIDVN